MTAAFSPAVRFRRGRGTMVPAMAAAYSLDVLFVVCVVGYGSRYLLNELQTSAAYPGYALAAYGLLKLAGALAGGQLLDASGILAAVTISALAEGAAFVLIIASGSALGYLAGVALLSFGIEIAWLVVFRAVGDASDNSSRAMLTAGLTAVSVLALGSGLALSVLLAFALPATGAFLIAGTLAALATAFLVQVSAQTRLAPAPEERARGRSAFALRSVLPFVVCGHFAVLSGALAVYTPFLLRRLDLDLFHAGVLVAPGAAIAAVAMLVIGKRSRPGHRLGDASVWYAIAATAMFGSAFTHSQVTFALLAIPLCAALAVTTPLVTAGMIDSASASERPGSAFGAMFFMEGLGGIGGPALAGAAISLNGIPAGAVLIAAGTFFLGAVALVVSRRRAY